MAEQKLKILIATIDLFGGTGTFTKNLAAGLRTFCPDKFDVSLLLLDGRGLLPADHDLFDRIEVLNTCVHDDWRRFYETAHHAFLLRGVIGRTETDLIFTVGNYLNLLAPLVAPDRRIILSEHAIPTYRLRDSRFPRIMEMLMRREYPERLVVSAASGIAQDLRENFHVQRTRVIPHGIDPAKAQAAAEEVLHDLPQRPYVVAVGRLSAEKDYPMLLRAYARAVERGMAEDLVIIGDGEERRTLERLAGSLHLDGRLHLLGFRPNPLPYIRAARYFVLSSIWEGFGYVLLEAMALGVPCIATDCPSGPPEILGTGEFGLLVPPADSAAMCEAMLKLSGSETLRSSLALRSRARASELSLERMAQEYCKLFREECGRS